MTNSTDTKNIKKIVRALLVKYKVVDEHNEPLLQAEIDFTSAWHRYVTEREDGLTPAEARLKIADEFDDIFISAKGQERNITRQEFMDVMKIDFGSEDNANWNTLLSHLVEAKAKGETIQKFAEWCKADPFNSPKVHQIAQNPLLVKQVWRSAFAVGEKAQSTDRSSMIRTL